MSPRGYQVTHLNSYYFSNRLHEVLVGKLAERGLSQHVFLPVRKKERVEAPAVVATSFAVPRCFSGIERTIWPLKMWRIWRAFERDRREHSCELHHAHTLFVNGVIAYLAKRKYGTPYVVTIRNTDVNQFLKKFPRIFRPIGLRIMREAEAVVTLSPIYWDRHIRSIYDVSELETIEAKHRTIPNGCEDFWFESAQRRTEIGTTLRLLFVGLLARNKNLRNVLSSCRLLSEREVSYELKVAGSGPMEAEYKAEAAGLPVRFFGHVKDRKQLLSIYRDSDLLVVPSRTESFGVVYVEAMTQGLPVIYTAGQGFDGFFPDGTVGFAVDSDDPAQIADCVVKIGQNYSKFTKKVAQGASRFRWNHAVDELLEVYEKASGRCKT